jgi:hypothetical protein
MIGYILTDEQKKEIEGVFYSDFEFFYCVQDINDIWFLLLSQQDKDYIVNTSWAWLLELPEGEYVPPLPPPFPPEPEL